MAELLVGTEGGLYSLERRAGTWCVSAQYLQGTEVNCVVLEPSGTALVASRMTGLFRLDLERDTITAVGAGVLPGVRCIAFSPSDADLIYVGTEPAGIFVSRDRGGTWQENAALADLRALRAWKYPGTVDPHIRNIIVDREDPNVLHAAVQIGGLLRSEDAGRHWVEVAAEIDPDVHAIMQHPTQPAVVFAVCGGGGAFPRTAAGLPPFPHGRPLYRSDDRGENWICISADLPYSYGVPIASVPGPSPVVLAGVARGTPPHWMSRPERADSALLLSEDDGTSWQVVMDGLPAPMTTMIEAIEVDVRRGLIFIGTGGDGSKYAAGDDPNQHIGELFCSRDARSGWERIPLPFPLIFTVNAI
jgi:hypothetical protein